MTFARSKMSAMVAASAVLAIALSVAACGGGGGKKKAAQGTTAQGTIKVAAALIGPKNDKSFNQAAYEGVQQTLGQIPRLKLSSTLENRGTDALRTDAIETLAPINKVVVAVSASFGPVLDVEAPKFPNTHFINIAGYTMKYHKNVTGFANDWGAPTYVAGVIAAKLTKTNVVGYVGGAEFPPTVQAKNAFAAGAKSVNPKIKVLSNIIGDFDDVPKAKAATAAMISDNADVIFPFLDSGIAGSYAAGKASGKDPAMFKLTIPDCTSYDNIVGTEVVNNKAATNKLLTDYADGSLKSGAIFLDLQNPTVETLQLCPKYQRNKAIAATTKKTIADINSGKTKLPKNAINPRPSYPHTEGF